VQAQASLSSSSHKIKLCKHSALVDRWVLVAGHRWSLLSEGRFELGSKPEQAQNKTVQASGKQATEHSALVDGCSFVSWS